jgi:protein phosphatase methylesterase 1
MDSMGGAIAVRVAAKRALPTLAGLVVIDVVEVSLYVFVM